MYPPEQEFYLLIWFYGLIRYQQLDMENLVWENSNV